MGFIDTNATGTSKWRWKLISIGFSPAMYLTDCDHDIEYGGQRWLSHGVQVSNITNPDSGPTMSFSVADADNYVFPFLNMTNGAEGLIVNGYLAEFQIGSLSATPDDVKQIFTGRVLSARKNTVGVDIVEFSCGPPALTSSINFPTRTFGSLARANP